MIRLDHVDMVKSASAWGRKVIFSDFGIFVGVRWAGLWMVSGLLLSKQNRNKKDPLLITKRGFFYAKHVEPWSRWAAATEDYTGCQSR